MRNLNAVFFGGNITRDPEIRVSPGPKATKIASFGIAQNRYVGKDDAGAPRYKALFIDVKAFGVQAERIEKLGLQKGSPIVIEGIVDFDQWEDKTNKEKRSKVYLVANEIHPAPAGNSAGGNGGGEQPDTGNEPF